MEASSTRDFANLQCLKESCRLRRRRRRLSGRNSSFFKLNYLGQNIRSRCITLYIRTNVYVSYLDTCHFQKLNGENSSSLSHDFHWNSVPTDIGNTTLLNNILLLNVILPFQFAHSRTSSHLRRIPWR